MDLTWLQCLIMGLVSGVAEFLPVSAEAHSTIVRSVLNLPETDALLRLILHGASLAALLWFCRRELRHLQEERKIQKSRSRSQKLHSVRHRRVMLQMCRSALLPIAVAYVLLRRYDYASQLQYLALILAANGLLLFLPSLFPRGNKDGRNMSPLDGFLMSLGSGMGFLPGLSRVSASLSLGILSGVNQSYALRLGLLMWIPCLAILLAVDAMTVVAGGLTLATSVLLRYLLAGIVAFFGSLSSLHILRFLSVKAGFSSFCFYSWGLALVSFILYLVV